MFGRASRAFALIGSVWLVVACSPQDTDEIQTYPSADEPEQSQRLDAPAPEPVIETLPPVRQIVPGGPSNALQAGDSVERLAAPPVPIAPPRPVNLGIVVVEAANRLETRRGAVTLEGTRAVDENAVCPLADGRTPTCHILARSAVRRYVGTRVVSCTLGVREDTATDHVAPCSVGESDLALWVVAQGWAFADSSADARLLAAQSQAQQNERGLWASLPDNAQPENTLPESTPN